MQSAIIGLICAVFAIALFASGAAVGWRLRGLTARPPDELTEDQKRKVEEARRTEEAFERLQNYSADDAYGMGGDGAFG